MVRRRAIPKDGSPVVKSGDREDRNGEWAP